MLWTVVSTRLSWLGVGMGKQGEYTNDVSRSRISLKRSEGIDYGAMKTWS